MKAFVPLLMLVLSAMPVRAADWQSGLSASPFIVAMLMMMEMVGLLDRSRDFTAVPYTPEYWNGFMPGSSNPFGMGMSPLSAANPMSMSPMMGNPMGSPLGMSSMGMSPMGMSGMGMPGQGMVNPMQQMQPWQQGMLNHWTAPGTRSGTQAPRVRLPDLQGSWETHTGALLVIYRDYARLYSSRDDYQDMRMRMDTRYIWLRANNSQRARQYAYRIHDGKLILRDREGSYLLLRRTRDSRR